MGTIIYRGPGVSGVVSGQVGGETLLSVVTITNGAASSKTNEPVSFGFPMAPTANVNLINVYDDDGTGSQGARLANFQVDNVSTDLNGKKRLCTITGIVPALISSGTRKLRVYTTATALPTGTAMVAGDILATSYECLITCVIGGTTFTASARTALGGGGTFGKTTAMTHGTWRSGPTCTEIICSTPLQNGGTAHASGNGLRAWFHIAAFKATTGAVGGGNPITYIRTRAIVENGEIQRPAAADYAVTSAKIERSTSLSVGTLISTTDTDPDGNTITYSYGAGYTHWYGSRFSRLVHVGTKPTNLFAYGDTSPVTATDSVHRNYMSKTCVVLPNWNCTFADITHNTGDVNFGITALNATGTTLPFQTTSGSALPQIGEIRLAQGGVAERQDISTIAEWNIDGLTKWNSDGRRRIFENAEYANTDAMTCTMRRYSTPPTHGVAGGYHRPDSGDSWAFNPAFGVNNISMPASPTNPWERVYTHDYEHNIVAYMLTGDCYYAEHMSARAGALRADSNEGFTGAGLNSTAYGDASSTGLFFAFSTASDDFGADEPRAQAWNHRTLGGIAFMLPDSKLDDKMVMNQTVVRTWLSNWHSGTWNKMNAHTGAGAIIPANLPTSGSNRFDPDGPRFTNSSGSNLYGGEHAISPPWQGNYQRHAMCWISDLGMGDTNLNNMIGWWDTGLIGTFANPNVVPDHMMGMFDHPRRLESDGVYDNTKIIKTWADIYKQMSQCTWNFVNTARVPVGSLILSALSGTSINVTLPSALLGQTSFYVGGYICQIGGGGAGVGKITAVADSSHCTVSTSANSVCTAYSPSTTITQGNWTVPLPHPLDAAPNGTMFQGVGGIQEIAVNYIDLHYGSYQNAASRGVSGALAAAAYIRAWGHAPNNTSARKPWNLDVRV